MLVMANVGRCTSLFAFISNTASLHSPLRSLTAHRSSQHTKGPPHDNETWSPTESPTMTPTVASNSPSSPPTPSPTYTPTSTPTPDPLPFSNFDLTMSDEFNTNGRTFKDGDDPMWTAIDKNDYTNNALHYYDEGLAGTGEGSLNIRTR